MESSPLTFKFAIDRGGTFTDLFASCSNGQIFTMKLLSENPTKYPDAAAECIRRVLSQVGYLFFFVLITNMFFINSNSNSKFDLFKIAANCTSYLPTPREIDC